MSELTARYFDVTPGNSAFFKASILKERDWIAVIYECDLTKDATRIARAALSERWMQAICFNLEHHEDICYSIGLTEQEITAVHRSYPAPSYAIVEIDEQFAIVSDSDYFWAVAGPNDFIAEVCKKDIAGDLDVFCEGIQSYLQSSDTHNRAMGGQMWHYLERCRIRFSEYLAGQEI